MSDYSFETLLEPLEDKREGRKLAELARQVKIEQAVLAEIMFNGNEVYPTLDFYLQEDRRDLTVRSRCASGVPGRLCDWVEAKMYHTDCLAHPSAHQALLEDARKQADGLKRLKPQDRATELTSLLLVVHNEEAHPRQKYHPGHRNRKGRSAEEIEQQAVEHAHNTLTRILSRKIVEEFTVALVPGTRLYVFAFRPECV